ncbi:MAG: sec-independent translocation protein [Bryobacterales bacterium]|jgi:sec-independent protein translocase protein TatA|nr:sec-independent translocation protein [Bryobacterales bacterium]
MGTLGIQEMIVIFVIALVLFGPKKLPELGRTIGKAITEFRRASNDLKATFEREMQTLERENQSLSQVTNLTAGEIFDHAMNYDPDHGNRSLPPAETAWNPLEPQKVDPETHESANQTPASLSTATEPSTVGASAVPGVESNGTVEQAVSPPESVPGPEGTVPRSEQPQHS